MHPFFALLAREYILLKRDFGEVLLNNFIMMGVKIPLLKYFLPALGMSRELILPLFIGSMVSMGFEVSYMIGFPINIDANQSKGGYFGYQLGLPISLVWVLAARLLRFIIIAGIMVALIGCSGLYLLDTTFLNIPSIVSLFCMFLLGLLFYGLLFATIALLGSIDFYTHRAWPRLLSPLCYALGGVFYSWDRINLFSPTIALITRCNPFIYITEGMRSVLLGTGDQGITLIQSYLVVTGTSILLALLLRWGIQKRFDLVGEK